ncbi:receptor-type tyrosine-protein phosphatase eta [Drosophila grimshawi]|uniref:protein-tyrosine-phosphatase n=1 Tax=Drosophila grimshawi TaxID=7222 RepID=B4JWA2_DROGR|nr:receptor-type tyrosine-protein phosphatase eta [Drosophila grimshawi]EDV98240.1 GH22999 [Drosophila grimshawi]
MRLNKHDKPRTRFYRLLCIPLFLLAWSQLQAQAQTTTAQTEPDQNDVVRINVVITPYTLTFSVGVEQKDSYIIENVACPSGGTSTALPDDNYICENLEPCTSYTNTVTLKGTAEGSTPFEQFVVAYTDYKDPVTQLLSVEATATTIVLNWETSDRSCVKHFEISATASDSSFSRQQAKEESSDIIEDVWPCRNYTVTLSTRNNESVIVDKDTTLLETDYLEPGDLQLTITTRSNEDTLITWNEPDNKSCIGSFTIVWRRNDCVPDEDGQTTTPEIDGETTTPEMDGETTTPEMDGETTTTEMDGETTTTKVDVDTTTTITDEETTTTITDDETTTTVIDDETAATVNLDHLKGTTSAPVQGSGIQAKKECEWSEYSNDSSLKQYTLNNLQGCAEHTIEVYINMERNTTAKATETFVSGERLPSAVSEPTQEIHSTELKWLWSPPIDHSKCVANYRVNLSGPIQREDFDIDEQLTSETFIVFSKLEPCGSYNVEIVPISLNGKPGAIYQGQSTLGEDQPTQILEPTSSTKPFSIELSWLTPSYADLCIAGYRISGWMDDDKEVDALSINTQQNSVVFEKDLIACQAYTIQIIPYTRENLDGELRQIEVETQAAVINFEKILLQVAGKKATSHSLELNAQNQDFNNNCQTIYAHFSCSTTANVRYNYGEMYVESYRDRGFQATIAPLSPYTQYICSVVLYNVAGASAPKRLTGTDLMTLVYFPDQPESVTLDGSTKHSLTFNWLQPKSSNGPIKYYQAFLMRYEADYFVPSICEAITEVPKTDTKGDTTNTFTDLSPAVKYIMQVAAQNDFGLGQYTAPIIGITEPDVSDPVTKLDVISEGPSLDPNVYSANVTVYWTIPCKSNGEIECFIFDFSGRRKDMEIAFQRKVPLDRLAKKGRMSYTETDLQPEVDYAVKVTVKTRNVPTLSESAIQEWTSPSGLPAGLGDDVVRQMRVSAYETSHPTSSAIVRLPANILDSESGSITYIALLLSQKSCTGPPELKYDVLNAGDWPSVASWDEVGGDCIYQYQTTPVRWKPPLTSRNRRDTSGEEEIVFVIGEGKCPDITERYCNGPLNPNMEYNMVVRLFTNSGYNDAAVLEFKTEAAIKVTLILISVSCCLLLAFILGLVVLYVRKRIAWHRDSGQGIEDPFGNVTPKNFAIFYADVSKPEKLAREFKEITVDTLKLSYAASELGCNKNRYADIYPYDKNRVILDIDTEGSDYINASFIDGHTRKKNYIATQGPKPESVMDFWRMILQHNVRVIVQVTQFREGNTIKCNEYYPYNTRGVIVTIKSKERFDIYDRTELTVVHEKHGLKEKVIHFYFKKWPDHGCPDDPNHLITFVKKVKAEKRPNYSPIVVHCSAGVGRTGTFIALDLIMQRLKSESKINIFETVKKLRFQRMKMVQTQQQYAFLYACTYELAKHKVPRAALKPNGRAKTNLVPTTKKVSFPDVDLDRVEKVVQDSPDPERGEANNLSRFGGLRRTTDLGSLSEQPERNSYNRPNGECAI